MTDPNQFSNADVSCAAHDVMFCAQCGTTGPFAPEDQDDYGFDAGQLRFAYWLAQEYAGDFMHVTGMGWYAWTGRLWQPDLQDKGIKRALLSLRLKAYRQVAEAENDARAEVEKGEYAQVTIAEKEKHIKELVAKKTKKLIADTRLATGTADSQVGTIRIASVLERFTVTPDQLDADRYLFNTPSGTVDLHTGLVRPHDRTDRITRISGTAIGDAADGPRWQRFLAEILPDPDVRTFLQRLFGYAMLGTVKEHIMPVLIGRGSNGKTTLTETIAEVFGVEENGYAITCAPGLLIGKAGEHTTGQTDLMGARLALTSETKRDARFSADELKRITGGERITARRMRENNITWTPSHTILMITNYAPEVDGLDDAAMRRLAVIPFNVNIPDEAQDSDLRETLMLELPAILAWCLDGYRQYQSQGLGMPSAVKARTREYREANDPLGRFIEECCATGDGYSTPPRGIYVMWKEWAERVGEDKVSEVKFSDMMKKKGFEKQRSNGVKSYTGIRGLTFLEIQARESGTSSPSADRSEPVQQTVWGQDRRAGD